MAKKKKSKTSPKKSSPSKASVKSKAHHQMTEEDEVLAAPEMETETESDVKETESFQETLSDESFQESLETSAASNAEETEEQKRIRLEFYGSDVLREKAPQAFELAEAVAQDWVNDGNFQKLPINSPLGQLVAAIGLQSAKRIEKKLEEKGVLSMAKMGLEIAKQSWPLKAGKNESV